MRYRSEIRKSLTAANLPPSSLLLILILGLVSTFGSCNKNPNRVYFTITPEHRTIDIPVYLDDSTIANMMFDTGCGLFTLDSLFVSDNPHIGHNTPDSIFSIGSLWSFLRVPASYFKNDRTVKIGGKNLTYSSYCICKYKDYFNTKADGLFGIPRQDTTHVWELNYEHNYLEIHQAEGFEMPKNCFLLPYVDDFTVQFPMLIEYPDGDTLTINELFFIDTGSQKDIVLVHPRQEELDFLNKKDDAIWITKNSQEYMRRYTANATIFDNFYIDTLCIYTLDNPRRLNRGYIIGQNFLKRFNVFFDQKNRQLGLQPIPNFQRLVSPNNGRFYFQVKECQMDKLLLKK